MFSAECFELFWFPEEGPILICIKIKMLKLCLGSSVPFNASGVVADCDTCGCCIMAQKGKKSSVSRAVGFSCWQEAWCGIGQIMEWLYDSVRLSLLKTVAGFALFAISSKS